MRHSVWSNWEIKDGSSENRKKQSSQVKQSNNAKKEGIITES